MVLAVKFHNEYKIREKITMENEIIKPTINMFIGVSTDQISSIDDEISSRNESLISY